MTTVTVIDPDSGLVDYVYTTEPLPGGLPGQTYVVTATDHDLADEQPWASYTIRNEYYLNGVVLDSIEAVMDDGSRVLFENDYFGSLGFPTDYLDRWTLWDSQGRIDYMWESSTPNMHGATPETPTYRALDYDTATGNLDYSIIRYLDGRQVSTDYDSATGNADYVLTEYSDGRVVAQDYNSTTGLLDYVLTTQANGDRLAQDYDAAGRLDYVVENLADGRMVVTDYDLNDQHGWWSYSIAYDAAGRISSVTVA